MLIDRQNSFSNEQALTATALSENVIDLGPLGGATANTTRDIGAGKTLYLHGLVTTTLDSAGEAATLTATLESDSVSTLDASATTHWSSGSIAEANLAAGTWVAKGVAIPPGAYEQYLAVRMTVGTENFTSGKISWWLSENRYDDRTYESGFSTGVN